MRRYKIGIGVKAILDTTVVVDVLADSEEQARESAETAVRGKAEKLSAMNYDTIVPPGCLVFEGFEIGESSQSCEKWDGYDPDIFTTAGTASDD